MLTSEELNGENNDEGNQNSENQESDQQDNDGIINEELELEERKAAIRKGKRPMSDIYEFKMAFYFSPITSPKLENFEFGETSENELKEDDNEYDYHQDLAILKSIYHYYFNHGLFPDRISDELIKYIEDLIPNLKVRGQALASKITNLRHNFSYLLELSGGYYYPEIISPVYREFYDLSGGLWLDWENYYPVDNADQEYDDRQDDDDGLTNEELELEERKAAIRKGKRPMSDIYEFKILTAEEVLSSEVDALYLSPTSSHKCSNLEIGQTSELKEDYDHVNMTNEEFDAVD